MSLLLVLLIFVALLIAFPLTAEEEKMIGDADVKEIILTAWEDELIGGFVIKQVTYHYEWDDVETGSAVMSASVK